MLRRAAFAPVTRRSLASSMPSMVYQRRLASTSLLGNLVSHDMGLMSAATYTSVGALATSPIGTTALVVVAYNTCVVGLKHLWYTLEMLCRDYLQDPVLAQTARYAILVCLMICCEVIFIEA
jgi:hypothetical protein